jgi:ATP-binding cassette subfamily B protein
MVTLIQGGIPVASAWVNKNIFDLLAQNLSSNATISWLQLLWFLVILAILTIIRQIIKSITDYLNSEMGRQLVLAIRLNIYQKVNSFMGLANFENPELHDAIQLANQGAQNSSSQTIWLLTSLLQNMVTILSFIGVLLAFNIPLAMLVIISALPQFYAQLKMGRQRVKLIHAISPDQRRKIYYESLLSGVYAAKEIRLYDIGEYLLNKFLQLYRKIHHAERDQQKQEIRWDILLSFLSTLASSIALIIVIREAFDGRISLGDVTLYISAVSSVQGGLSGCLFAISSLNESCLFFSYYENLLSLPDSLPPSISKRSIKSLELGIELRHVSFRYSHQHPWILQGVNLYIPVGHCTALVGLNGAGKTTLAKLLLRFYDPTEGEILWDGVDIRQFDPKALRQQIGAIFQDYLRYDLTVQENIGLGNIHSMDNLSLIRQAAIASGAEKMIRNLPDGYNTDLSLRFANGKVTTDLSGGEWQKIAIARMFMRSSGLLILDEPSAALDAEAEHELYLKFTQLVEKNTSILISHRFSTVRMAEYIAVLKDGKIIEYGSHQELLSLKGSYAKMYTRQAEKYDRVSN